MDVWCGIGAENRVGHFGKRFRHEKVKRICRAGAVWGTGKVSPGCSGTRNWGLNCLYESIPPVVCGGMLSYCSFYRASYITLNGYYSVESVLFRKLSIKASPLGNLLWTRFSSRVINSPYRSGERMTTFLNVLGITYNVAGWVPYTISFLPKNLSKSIINLCHLFFSFKKIAFSR